MVSYSYMTIDFSKKELEDRIRALEKQLEESDLIKSKLKIYENVFHHVLHEVHVWELIRNNDHSIKTWKLVDANPAALKSWNKDLKDIIGKTTDEIFPGVNATEQFLPIVDRIFKENQPHKWETFFPATNQTLYMVSVPFGEHFISTGIDITHIRNTEKNLSYKHSIG